jgi:hypothetical protein
MKMRRTRKEGRVFGGEKTRFLRKTVGRSGYAFRKPGFWNNVPFTIYGFA